MGTSIASSVCSFVASIYIVLSIAVERYLAVCRPHQYREMQGRRNRSLLYICPVLIFSFVINIPKWMDIRTIRIPLCYDYSNCFGTKFIYSDDR